MNKKMTLALCESPLETLLAEQLFQFDIELTPQVEIGPYRVDFLIDTQDNRKLIVECDGEEFHQNKEYDDRRQSDLEARGYKFIRFTGREINKDAYKCAYRVFYESLPMNYIEIRVYENGTHKKIIHADNEAIEQRLSKLKVEVEVG